MRYKIVDDACGRYTLHQKAGVLAKRYNLASEPKDLRENYNVAPGHIMPVVTRDDKGTGFEMMKWGLIPFWAKDPKVGYSLINARDDTVFEKRTWSKLILTKRCLIPADGFYEWKKHYNEAGKIERKEPFYIRPKQIELFSFAGVWATWKDVEGLEWKTYSIITTEPNKEVAKVHNRMPVILHQEDETSWLEPSRDKREDIEPFLHPLEDNGLEIYGVSEDVNGYKFNDKHLIEPLAT